jgi:hypothetical protein
MLTQYAPAVAGAGAGLSPAPTERAAAGRWNDPGVDDDRPAEHVLRDAYGRATRGKAETSVCSVSHAGRAQINPICAAAPINRSPLARLQNGGYRSSSAA